MNELIRYQQLENGIHEIKFLQKTRASIDVFYRQMQSIYEKADTDSPIRIIVDLSLEGVIPMQYMFQEGQHWRRRNPKNLPIRVIILYPEKGVLPIARVLINAVLKARGNQAKLHMENIANREAAIEWLMGDSP